ncbi:hypothetical protein KJ641_01055 [Patescibacteria group bacterium]|nr:hypothetical protein [Patescibacteria group bacterium]MBU1895445.1 hypothetical protein [Patescibacteria group bacterium]
MNSFVTNKLGLFILFFVFAGSCFFIVGHVRATTISPIRQTAVVDLGSSETFDLEVTNDSESTKIYLPEVDSFSIEPSTGAAIFGSEDIAVNWIEVEPNNIRLLPGRKGSFVFTVNTPKDTEPSSHYLGLFAKEQPAEGQVGVGSRIGSLLFLHVAGPVVEGLVEQRFETTKKIYKSPPVDFLLRLKNHGTIHLIPQGRLVVRGWLGEEIVSFEINSDGRKVLPGDTWEETYQISEEELGTLPGRVKADFEIYYGLSEKTIKGSSSFWYLPNWFLVFVFSPLLILFIILLLWKILKKKKSKNDYETTL